jgi:hypothetical protein
MEYRIKNIVSRVWGGKVIPRGKIIKENEFKKSLISFFWSNNWICIQKKVDGIWVKTTPHFYFLKNKENTNKEPVKVVQKESGSKRRGRPKKEVL